MILSIVTFIIAAIISMQEGAMTRVGFPKPAEAEMSVTAAVRPAAGSGGYGVEYRFRRRCDFHTDSYYISIGFYAPPVSPIVWSSYSSCAW